MAAAASSPSLVAWTTRASTRASAAASSGAGSSAPTAQIPVTRPDATAAEIGRALGLTSSWGSARQVFEDVGRRVAGDLPGYQWNSLPSIDRRKGLVPLAAGTVDGRLPGQRERMPLDGSGNVEWDRLPTSREETP